MRPPPERGGGFLTGDRGGGSPGLSDSFSFTFFVTTFCQARSFGGFPVVGVSFRVGKKGRGIGFW